MLWTLLSSLALAAEPAPLGGLAEGVKLYYDVGPGAAAGVFEALYLDRPFDDDLAWWVGRTRLDRGQAEDALTVVAGRQGRKLPTWRFQVLEATALILLERDGLAAEILAEAWPQVRGTSDRPAVAAQYGLLLLKSGAREEAVVVLAEAGADPRQALDPVLSSRLPPARLFDVRGEISGELDVTRRDGTWRVDLESGLAVPGPDADPEPVIWRRAAGSRGRADACPGAAEGHVWTSPREPLGEGLPGLYRSGRGSVERLALTPSGAVDLSPACLGDSVWFIRRLGEHAGVLQLDGRALREVSIGPGAVATVDARAGRPGQAELVLGLVVDGKPGVWWLPSGATESSLLIVDPEPILAPRWVD